MNNTTKKFIQFGTILMALSIGFGAFGAHALKEILDEHMLKIYHTGVQYQFYHALGLFVVAFVSHINFNNKVKISGYVMLLGTAIFSGSLYILALSKINIIGAITPIGGVFLIISWIVLFLSTKE